MNQEQHDDERDELRRKWSMKAAEVLEGRTIVSARYQADPKCGTVLKIRLDDNTILFIANMGTASPAQTVGASGSFASGYQAYFGANYSQTVPSSGSPTIDDAWIDEVHG